MNQTLTIIISILVPMFSCFIWVINKIDKNYKDLKNDIGDLKERMTYLEAESTIYNTIPDPNSRSEAAKRSWVRRKAKQAAKLEKK